MKAAMNIKVHFIQSLYLLFLATTDIWAQKDPPKASHPLPPPLPPHRKGISGDYKLYIAIPLFGGIAIIIILVFILFKRKRISSHAFILGFWMMMWFGSTVLNSWDIPLPHVARWLVGFHIVSNVLGLIYWIRLGLKEYNRKNKWPSVNLMFEIGAWFSMFVLSLIEVFVLTLVGKHQYNEVSHWYPVAIAFISMVENYWTKGREIRADRKKSQLVRNLEEAFDEVIRLCLEDPRKVSLEEFDQKVEEFYRLLDMLVAQTREAIIVAQQREAMKQQQQSGAPQGAQTGGDIEVQIDEDPTVELGQPSS